MRPKGRRRRQTAQHTAAKLIWQRGENPFRADETRLHSGLSRSLFPKMVPNAMPGWWYVLQLDVASTTLEAFICAALATVKCLKKKCRVTNHGFSSENEDDSGPLLGTVSCYIDLPVRKMQ